ncbi:MAG TPA: disulfide bond formation protein B [Reyranella sp.]|nr:disulfide bond formation protein B [Reyranella sp.]
MSSASRFPFPAQVGLVAFAASAALLGGAYYFQYVVGLEPCDLCWLQRYPHMAAIGLGLASVASFAWPRLAFVFALCAIVALFATAGIGVYHFGVEHHWWLGPSSCTSRLPAGLSAEELKKRLFSTKMVLCDSIPWQMWGISMAGWNALLSGGIAVVLVGAVSRHIRAQS